MVSPNGPGMYTLNVADAGLVDLGQTWRGVPRRGSTACCSTSTSQPSSRLPTRAQPAAKHHGGG